MQKEFEVELWKELRKPTKAFHEILFGVNFGVNLPRFEVVDVLSHWEWLTIGLSYNKCPMCDL